MSEPRKLRRSEVARKLLPRIANKTSCGEFIRRYWLLGIRRSVVLLKKDNAKAIAKADIKTEPKVECKNAAGGKDAEAKKAKVEETKASGKVTNKDMKISMWLPSLHHCHPRTFHMRN